MSQQQPSTPPKVREIIAALEKLDPELPVLVSTHYDNDVGHASEVSVYKSDAYPEGEGDFWNLYDRDDQDDDDDLPDDVITAIVIEARG